MKVTKDFYKSWHDETNELFRDVQNDEATMTEEEKAADRIRSTEEFEKIWAKAKEAEKQTRFISIPFQRQKFAWLVKMALLYAEDAGVDISYETTKEHGSDISLIHGHPAFTWHFIGSFREIRHKKRDIVAATIFTGFL